MESDEQKKKIEMEKTQLSSEKMEGTQQSLEKVEETQQSLEKVEETQQSLEKVEETQQSLEKVEETQQSLEKVEETQQSLEKVEETQQSLEKVEETQQSLEKMEEAQQQSLEKAEETQQSLEKMEETQQSLETTLKRKAEKDNDIPTEDDSCCESSKKYAKLDDGTLKTSDRITESSQQNDNNIDMTSSVSDNILESRPGAEIVSTKNGGNLDSKQYSAIDPLGYTKGEEFTSEIFKIQIHNLPKFFGYSDLKKRLISLGLKPHKFKSPRREVTYVCFRNEADRLEALKKINGHHWKGKKLEAKEAAPLADPFLEKRRQKGKKSFVVAAVEEPQTFEESQNKLKDSVVPLWKMDYSKQLETKTQAIRSILKNLTHRHLVREQFRRMKSWNQDGMPCPLLPIIPSPVTSEYRNKNQFTVGYSQDGETIKVGFRFGLYKDGTTSVGDCTHIGVVRAEAVPVLQSFEKFVSKSKWLPYLQQTGTGHWQTLTLRSFDSGDIMAMVDFHPRKLDKDEIAEAKDAIRDFYMSGDGKDINIKSFYFRLNAAFPEGVPRLEKIYGEPYVFESLLGLKFRVSPEAFFQVNTKAAEKLYSLIGEWCEASESSTVLDICCGTGTIGLSIAKNVKQVIGVEMCESAVEDAKENASLNDITNVTYYCSKVEDVIGKVLGQALNSSVPCPTSSTDTALATPTSNSNNIIAVVDPPRAGLHKSVVKMLRKNEEIKRLVYISCDPENAMDNFMDLIRPSSGKLRGQPFTLEKAVPVDLFPGTKHCELVLLFNR